MLHSPPDKKNFTKYTQDLFENKTLQSRINNFFFKKKEKSAKEKNLNYFNKNKNITIICWFLLFLILITVSLNVFLDLKTSDFSTIFKTINVKKGFLFTAIFSLSIFLVNDCLLNVCGYRTRIKRATTQIDWKDWFSFAIISFFIQSITPFALGAEPFAIWWLKKHGVEIQEAAAIVAVTSFAWFIGQFLITWPSFIYLTVVNINEISSRTVARSYWFILIGLLVDLFIGFLIFLISYCNVVHYYFAKAINSVKKFLYLEYASDSELSFKYLLNDSFKRIYLKQLKNKRTIFQISIFLMQNFLIYALFAKLSTLISTDSDVSFFRAFHIINVSTTANNFLPVPSSEGSLQFTIKELHPLLIKNYQFLDSIIFFWRCSCKYIGVFVGALYIVIFGINPKSKVIKLREEIKLELI